MGNIGFSQVLVALLAIVLVSRLLGFKLPQQKAVYITLGVFIAFAAFQFFSTVHAVAH